MKSYDPYKPKLVFIVSRFPYPLEKGDKLRAFYQIKELSKHFNIELFALTERNILKNEIEILGDYCQQLHIYRLRKWMIAIQILISFFSRRPFQVAYFYDPFHKKKLLKTVTGIKPDQIYCQLIRTTEYVKDYHYCPKTLDYMDALSKGMERRIKNKNPLLRLLFKTEAKRLSEYERQIFSYFENKTIISEQDRELIHHPNRKEIKCIPNGIDDTFFEELNCEENFDLVFVGNLSYAPNIEAVEFIEQIIIENPNLNCLIAGANPGNKVKKIDRRQERITLRPWVEDIRTAYCSGKIFVAPMMIGTGMQNKLLEAMAMGIPCITTSLANNAIKAVHNNSIIVANTKEEFNSAIIRLLKDRDLKEKISIQGKEFVRENYSWNKSVRMLLNECLTVK